MIIFQQVKDIREKDSLVSFLISFPPHFHFMAVEFSYPYQRCFGIGIRKHRASKKTLRIHSIAVGPAVISLTMMNSSAKNSAEFSGAGEDMSICSFAHQGLAEI